MLEVDALFVVVCISSPPFLSGRGHFLRCSIGSLPVLFQWYFLGSQEAAHVQTHLLAVFCTDSFDIADKGMRDCFGVL
jgi:hypothetical protein